MHLHQQQQQQQAARRHSAAGDHAKALRHHKQHRVTRLAAGSTATSTSTSTSTTPAPSRDVTADILQAVMALALKKRLREYESVDASVSCDARGLMDGRFNSMCIEGRHWHTPLGMTAHKLEVQIGAMQVDLGTLVWERRVAMQNVPLGAVQIHLSGKDMGNFVSHPLFQQAASTAVQGHAFTWERGSVDISHQQRHVLFTGRWAANGERYRILMRPGSSSGSSSSLRRPPLQVGAQLVTADGRPAGPADIKGTQVVAQEMANFFTNMSLDLQGIEIKNPALLLTPGNSSERGEGDLLEINMKLRLRALPPMDMQF